MSNLNKTRLKRRMDEDLAELAERIARAVPSDGAVEVQPGVHFRRMSESGVRMHGVYGPAFCVMAQGGKIITLGEESVRYDPANYLITTMELPLSGEVFDATPARPYLGFRLILDPAMVTSLMVETGLVRAVTKDAAKAIDVSPIEPGLLDATLRLTRMSEDPDEYRVLAPLVIRELVYRLMKGAQGDRLCHLARFGGQDHRMVRAVAFIRENFDQPLKVEEVASELSMSVSGFHAHFKAVTALSPLQFQKQLRLQEARRLMLNEKLDAAEAGHRVGYEDSSYFSRDYKRNFGEPPMRHVEQLRAKASSVT